jgi:DNA-binding transcriptional regulator YiaG
LPFSTWEVKVAKPNRRSNPRAKYQVGVHIKLKRTELGMSQDDVATFFEVDIQTLIAWEFGTVPMKRQTPKLIDFLGYNPYEGIVNT